MTDYEIPRPTSGDVVELILDDHRMFEDLLRECRRTDSDRAAARQALAEILVAHATAEEETVYPTLRRRADDITAHEAEHGEEEHAEITEALLAFLEAKGTDTDTYDEALEDLATVVNHHSNEEEQTILNPAREEVDVAVRERLAVDWLTRRNQLLEAGCASTGQVKALLDTAVHDGTIAPAPARAEAEEIQDEAKARAHDVEESAKQDG
ncbi:hemerythrin domain-containing protein [Phycicoccus sp. BSK3Z-2]|uniref:Hemerythrin domain-containing protein n=1 Tax=Phycicoccus avicenniae TaxID=2828860 RepID=A0A941D6L6_9MICO|nr:hemerythrin domain-containing protein [Phycicoccus avicenniae]MBR7742810.1 hemerythrin domain-containing protein [Phycicoccus avicenniae]